MTIDDYLAWITGAPPEGVAKLSQGEKSALELQTAGGTVNAGFQAASAGFRGAAGFAGLDAAKYAAAQLRESGGQSQAASQRQAVDIDRQTQMIQSRALAVAAASGGGASDPGVINILANTAAEGAYRKALALFNGDDRARAMDQAAENKIYEGKVEKTNALIGAAMQTGNAGASLLASKARGKSLYERFAGGGPTYMGGSMGGSASDGV